MNWDRIQGDWRQLKGKVKAQWGKITDDERDVILGQRDQLLGRMQKSYAAYKDEAERQLRHWQAHHQRDFEDSGKRH